MNTIEYKINHPLDVDEVIAVINDSGLKRPTDDRARIQKMFDNANLIVSAWKGNELVGIARSVTDFSFCCYLSDLAVKKDFQKTGIGKRLAHITKEQAGRQCIVLLLSVQEAMEYYPKIGFEKANNAFITWRES